MTNRDPDSDSGDLFELLELFFEQSIKGLNFGLPGIVHSYSDLTGRATVQPLIDILKTDDKRVEPPLIANVPILQPAVAGYEIHLPVAKDDSVWIAFSQRGLTEFKKTLRRAGPDPEALLSLKDAMAFPVKFKRANQPPTDGLVIGTANWSDYLSIKPGEWLMKHSGTITIDGPNDTLVWR